MDILKKGKISLEELASWFNTSKSNLSKNKQRYLKELKKYCDFDAIYGGVIIKDIYIYTYIKNPNYKIVLDNIDKTWSKQGLDTCSNVGTIIYQEHKQELTVQQSTTIVHTAQARNELWGSPKDKEERGKKGTCYYLFCKKNENGRLEYLSSREETIKRQLLQKWFGDADEKTAIIQGMINNKEIDKTEAWDHYSKIMRLPKSYVGFIKDFKEKTGVQLIRGTQVERDLVPVEKLGEKFTFS